MVGLRQVCASGQSFINTASIHICRRGLKCIQFQTKHAFIFPGMSNSLKIRGVRRVPPNSIPQGIKRCIAF